MIPPLTWTDAEEAQPRTGKISGRGGVGGMGDARLRSLVEPNFASLWRALRRFGVPASSLDDAVQQVLLVVAAKLDRIEVGRERAFLLGIAHGVSANFRRLHARRAEVAYEDELVAAHPDPDPETLLELKHRRALLDEALDALSEDQRAVFVLFELEGCTMIEIAEALSLPMGTVASRLRRGRARFEEKVLELKRRDEETDT
jgi:RNA polymerase sigma-70 factor, ECF subfamily